MSDRLVEVLVEDQRWAEAGIEAIAERAARATLAAMDRDPARHEIAWLACSDARIAGLNAEFRGKPLATNVLSWPDCEGPAPAPGSSPLFLGDIAIAYETCAREAEDADIPLSDHAMHLVVHAVLHLLGLDHQDETEAEAMERLETNVLASMGIANPYSGQGRPWGVVSGQE
jgi:probable rRNA maturation factor